MPRRKLYIPRRRSKKQSVDLEMLKAATDLFIMSLKRGSSIDIYYAKEDCFYEAWVKDVYSGYGCFKYVYKNKKQEGGFVRLSDCLRTWRPPMNHKILTPKTMVLMYDDSVQ